MMTNRRPDGASGVGFALGGSASAAQRTGQRAPRQIKEKKRHCNERIAALRKVQTLRQLLDKRAQSSGRTLTFEAARRTDE